jgi:ERCC4-type nuclease
MLLVDYRAGSKELVKPLTKILGKDDVEETSLDFGDVAFSGRGVNGSSLDIGIEFKTISDIVQCCHDGRFAGHQLPGMRKTYDYSWLVIEGAYRHDEHSGLITTLGRRGWQPLAGKMRASELEKHILTFELCGGVHTHYTNTRGDSVRFISSLYRWWTDRALDGHTSHLAIHEPVVLGTVSDFRRAVMMWPGIGLKTSKAVEKEFNGSIWQAATATIDDWARLSIDGRRFGFPAAQKVVKFIRG